MRWPRTIARVSPWAIALVVLVGAGLEQGRLDGRWASAEGLDGAVERIRGLPAVLGSWRGEEGDADPATLRHAGIAGGILRRYRDSLSGAVVSALLVCGRPGPVAVHTPDVCYRASGYQVEFGPAEAPGGFLVATMVRTDTPVPERLQVSWSWNAGDRWEAPANPRSEFGARPYLYKLYVVRPMVGPPGAASEAADRFCRDLAQDLVSKLRVSDRWVSK